MVLKKVSFGTTTIQSLRRITLDQNILDTLELEVGDQVKIELDTETATVLISRAPQEKSAEPTRKSRAKRN